MATKRTTKTSKGKATGTGRGAKKASASKPKPKPKPKPKSKSAGPAKKKAASAKKAATKKPAASKKTNPKSSRNKTAGKSRSANSKSARTAAVQAVDSAAVATLAAPPPADTAAEIGLLPAGEEHLPPVKIAKRDLAAIEKALHKIRNQLSQDVDALTQNNLSNSGREMSGDLSGYGFHMADVATDNFAREMELNIATGETNRLRLLEEALDRLKDGTFGRCLVCTDPIGVERLKVIPYARLCIRCAEEAERR